VGAVFVLMAVFFSMETFRPTYLLLASVTAAHRHSPEPVGISPS
jgi:hypothetical protein